MVGSPKLEGLDISNNLIDKMDDIAGLGSLKSLAVLDITGNPICQHLIRV